MKIETVGLADLLEYIMLGNTENDQLKTHDAVTSMCIDQGVVIVTAGIQYLPIKTVKPALANGILV